MFRGQLSETRLTEWVLLNAIPTVATLAAKKDLDLYTLFLSTIPKHLLQLDYRWRRVRFPGAGFK